MVNAKVFLRLLRLTTAGAFCRFAQVLVDRMIFRGKIDRRNYDAWWLTLVHGKVFWQFLFVGPSTRNQPMDFLAIVAPLTGVSLAIVPMKTLSRLQAHGKGKKTLEVESEWTIQGEISRQSRILSLLMTELHLEIDDLFTVQKKNTGLKAPQNQLEEHHLKMDRYSLTWETYHPKSWTCLPVIQENHGLVEYALRL